MKSRRIALLSAVSMLVLAGRADAQQPLTSAVYITAEQVQAVNAAPGTDRQIRIMDLGEYQLAVGIIHRGPTARPAAAAGAGGAGGGAAAGGGAGAAGGAAAAAAPASCGVAGTAPAGSATGIAHDATTETYIIVSGSGTLVTGGQILNGRRSAPESSVTRILNGPSCSGVIGGTGVERRVVKTGDIIVIPAGVPHGWTDIEDHVDYLSIRPDPDKVLDAGYVHPAIQ